jgi:hypothetical protein
MKKIIILAVLIILFFTSYNNFIKPYLAFLLQSLPISSETLGPPKSFISANDYVKSHNNLIKKIERDAILYKNIPFPFDNITAKKHNPLTITNKNYNKKVEVQASNVDSWLYQIGEARVYSYKGLIITKEKLLIKDNAHNWHKSVKNEHPIFNKLLFKIPENYDQTVAVIAVNGHDCFYHWLCDVLPRLEILKKSKVPYDKIYVGKITRPFQKETLKHFGITSDQIIEASRNTHIKAKNVLFPSQAKKSSVQFQKWMIDFLREEFLNNNESTKRSKRIYISRSKASRRAILNEEEFLPLLEEHGFESVILEDLAFKEQAALFNSCEAVIGYHGSGFSNLIFCKPNTKVLELFHPEFLNGCFWDISQKIELNHFLGTIIPDNNSNSNSNGSITKESLLSFLQKLEVK